MKPAWEYIKRVFSDGGEPSFSRWSSGTIVLATIIWVSYLVFRKHELPDLTGPAIFIGSGTGSAYGLNILSGALKKKGE